MTATESFLQVDKNSSHLRQRRKPKTKPLGWDSYFFFAKVESLRRWSRRGHGTCTTLRIFIAAERNRAPPVRRALSSDLLWIKMQLHAPAQTTQAFLTLSATAYSLPESRIIGVRVTCFISLTLYQLYMVSFSIREKAGEVKSLGEQRSARTSPKILGTRLFWCTCEWYWQMAELD